MYKNNSRIYTMKNGISSSPYSSLGIKYPKHRDDAIPNVDTWLEDKKDTDGAEGLWRIHNALYDLTDFISFHPGGSEWLQWTKGTDITEAFESHHISNLAENLLPKYYVGKAKSPRNLPFTFRENGFYMTLKKRIKESLKDAPEAAVDKTKLMTDLLLIGYLGCAMLAAVYHSYAVGVAAGVVLCLLTIAAHNFFHRRNNFRMYYFDLSFLSSREWRISHVLSHHMYTNTILDLEISSVEPFLNYLPDKKHIITSIMSIIISPILYAATFKMSFVYRLINSFKNNNIHLRSSDLLPFAVLTIMYYVSEKSLLEVFTLWLFIIITGSFNFMLIGVNAAHHDPNIFHDGDAVRSDLDWGLAQMDAVMDRKEITGNDFMVLTSFGDHALHHLFPTIDHGKLKYLYPALLQTCKEFKVDLRITSQFSLIVGQFRQLMNDSPNKKPPG